MRVKLVAIAKNEGAYLAEWLFHHLYFGFSSIDIYVNNSNDNSLGILDKINRFFPVCILDGDEIYNSVPGNNSFQKFAYEIAYEKALAQGFDYLIFLDIDEFWTPLNFRDSINDCLFKLKNPDIISFEWVCKRDEFEPFLMPYNYKNLVNKHPLTKSIFNLNLGINDVDIHNVTALGAKNILADASLHPMPFKHAVGTYHVNHVPIKPYFILHRLWRSKIEYIALLGQGMRQSSVRNNIFNINNNNNTLELKLNRRGYLLPKHKVETIYFSNKYIDSYYENFKVFVEKCELKSEIETAQIFVLERFFSLTPLLLELGVENVPNNILANIDVLNTYREAKELYRA